jgi:hypothetical protein
VAMDKGDVHPWVPTVDGDNDVYVEEREETCITWKFGRGEEGVKERLEGTGRITAVVVDSIFPWWLSPALSVDITVSRIWLTSYKLIDKIMTNVIKD